MQWTHHHCSPVCLPLHHHALPSPEPHPAPCADFSRSPFQCPVQQDTTTTTTTSTSSTSSTSSKAAASYATFFKGSAPLLPAPPFAGCDHRMTFLDAISRLGVERLQRADELGITYDQMEFGVGLNPTQAQQRSRAVQPFFDKLCAAVRRTWVLSDELRHIADYELSQLQLLPGPLVVVHIRGGDKLANGTTEIPPGYAYNFTAGMRRLVRAHPKAAGGSCVLLGDDATLLPVVATAARSVLRCKTVVSRLEPAYAHVQKEFNAQPVEQRCARTKKYLVDLELLARADYSLGTVHSNVDLLAYQIQRCVVGKAGDTYVDLAGWSYDGYSPKLNAHMMPPHIMELFPEALEGHQDPGGTGVHVAGRDGNSSLALSSGVLDLRHVAEGEEEYGEEPGRQGVLGGLLRWLGLRGREQREEQS